VGAGHVCAGAHISRPDPDATGQPEAVNASPVVVFPDPSVHSRAEARGCRSWTDLGCVPSLVGRPTAWRTSGGR